MPGKALVIGSGPNGLSAGIVLSQAGFSVNLCEASPRLGGGASSAELTLPGFLHDVGSAVHPLALASPFFSSISLDIDWIHPPLPLAHPLDDGSAVLLHRDIVTTADSLDTDAKAWLALFEPIASEWNIYRQELLSPLGWTWHPWAMARFGANAILPASTLLRHRFSGVRARALFAGLAAHYPFLDQPLSAGFGLVLGSAAHAVGWPIPRGGAQSITDALVSVLKQGIVAAGGSIQTGTPVQNLPPRNTLVLADTSPRMLAQIAKDRLPSGFARQLNSFRYGPGAFKIDWALDGPVPWRNQECAQAGTVHVGGTAEQIQQSEHDAINGRISDRPFVLLSQPTLFDPSRAPVGRHIAWGYCHAPHASNVDMTTRIEAQIERFAPGFRDRILVRHVSSPVLLEQQNPNLVGGDVTGGLSDWSQLLFRPTWRRYRTPDPEIWLCSASTPPGAGVHGMCGYHAARQAIKSFSK